MTSKKNNTKKATATSEKDVVVATTPTTEVAAPVTDDTAPVADVTEPVVEETAPVADDSKPVVEETAPVVEAPKSSLKIGRKEEPTEFLKFEHPDKRILQFKVDKDAQIGVFGSIWTPARFLKEGNEAKLLEFVTNHPRYFKEVFE
jgi:hypothetical protein